MSWKNTDSRYGTLSITMHWLMLALLIAVYACILLHGEFPKSDPMHQTLKTWHFMLGLSVFGLVFLRLAFRLAGSTPRIAPPLPPWQHWLAKLMHLSLYAFMLVMPILGWLTLSAAGKTIPLFGLGLPPLIGYDKPYSKELEHLHETIGTIGYYLIGFHAAAALFHHYFVRDNTLLRMLPRRNVQ